MRKFVLTILFLFLFSSVALGGSNIYEGFPVINVKVNGQLIQGDTPAINLNGRTMVPVRFVSEALGAKVGWDQDTYTTNITNDIGTNLEYIQSQTNALLKIAQDHGATNTIFEINNAKVNLVTFISSSGDVEEDTKNIYNLSALSVLVSADNSIIKYYVNRELTGEYIITREDTEKWLGGKITSSEYYDAWLKPINNLQELEKWDSVSPSPESSDQQTYKKLLYSNDRKTFLGEVTSNKFDSDSICNEFGTYGSEFSSKSIWNEFGTYGSDVSNESAFNKLASKPPVIIENNKVIGNLTINTNISDAISPYGICE